MYNNYNVQNIQKHKSIHDPVKEAMSVAIRDTMHNLDLTNEANLELYNQQKLKYIAMFEGRESKAYDDDYGKGDPKYAEQIFAAGKQPKGNITVGYGFNMDSLGARAEWNRILKNEVSFDEVRNGKAELNDDQMMRLLKYSVNIREIELQRSFKEVWNKLRANERIAVLSAYYNSPKLVNTSTRFFDNLKKYTETGDTKYLKAAIAELESCRKNPELISRRELEAKTLDSTKAPFHLKPNEKPVSAKPLKVIHGVTKVPLGLEQSFPQIQDSEFVVWRTRLDDRVRDEHLQREGIVYHINEIAGLKNYGCRCTCEPVTTNLLITDKDDKIISLGSWIRYGGDSTYEEGVST